MRRKNGCSCINLENGVDAWSRKTRAHASLFGCEAGGRPNRRQRRGARRRRNKGLRGVRYHVRYAGGALSSEGVVLDDEGTRFCGERSTTSGTPAAPWAPKTWCSTTKEQGFAGSEAPRPVRRRRLELGRHGARRRRNKVLRGVRHHVRYAGGALSSEDVVLDDERTRACGRRNTTSGTPAAPWAPKTWCSMTKEQDFAGSEAPRPVRRRRLALGRRPIKKGPTHSRSS